jgi:hypothetical protein
MASKINPKGILKSNSRSKGPNPKGINPGGINNKPAPKPAPKPAAKPIVKTVVKSNLPAVKGNTSPAKNPIKGNTGVVKSSGKTTVKPNTSVVKGGKSTSAALKLERKGAKTLVKGSSVLAKGTKVASEAGKIGKIVMDKAKGGNLKKTLVRTAAALVATYGLDKLNLFDSNDKKKGLTNAEVTKKRKADEAAKAKKDKAKKDKAKNPNYRGSLSKTVDNANKKLADSKKTSPEDNFQIPVVKKSVVKTPVVKKYATPKVTTPETKKPEPVDKLAIKPTEPIASKSLEEARTIVPPKATTPTKVAETPASSPSASSSSPSATGAQPRPTLINKIRGALNESRERRAGRAASRGNEDRSERLKEKISETEKKMMMRKGGTVKKEHVLTTFRKANEARQAVVKKSLPKAEVGMSTGYPKKPVIQAPSNKYNPGGIPKGIDKPVKTNNSKTPKKVDSSRVRAGVSAKTPATPKTKYEDAIINTKSPYTRTPAKPVSGYTPKRGATSTPVKKPDPKGKIAMFADALSRGAENMMKKNGGSVKSKKKK